MSKYYVKASDLLARLRDDKDGVVSFEYIIVAVLIITAVGVAYGVGGLNVSNILTNGFGNITAAFTAAI